MCGQDAHTGSPVRNLLTMLLHRHHRIFRVMFGKQPSPHRRLPSFLYKKNKEFIVSKMFRRNETDKCSVILQIFTAHSNEIIFLALY
jgi:hypothetical protein